MSGRYPNPQSWSMGRGRSGQETSYFGRSFAALRNTTMISIKEAALIILSGGIVAYPTESFYALGADATNARAVKKVFNLKGRDRSKPIALIAGNQQQVERFFTMTKAERGLAHRHWPGGLTVLLRPKTPIPSNSPSGPPAGRAGRGRGVAAEALAGTSPAPSYTRRGASGERLRRPSVGVRIPAHAPARALALSVGAPITATSANRSGRPPTKSARKVKRDFPGILIAPGRCGRQRRPSTVVALSGGRPVVLRRGQVKI